jgi:outer membrane receptor protein involved in Fe transport
LKLPWRLRVTGGVTYENVRLPENFRFPPIQEGEKTRKRLNPKVSLVWELTPQATIRAVYARSLGGVSLDESFRLEPTQLAGFGQAFRTLIPESLVGSVSAPDHEIWGTALDLKFPTRTYIGFEGALLRSQVQQTVGVFGFFDNTPPPTPNILPFGTSQRLDYQEPSLHVIVNQLFSHDWSLGAQYSFVRSELQTDYPALIDAVPSDSLHADLHRATTFLLYNHRYGLFARADWDFYFQNRSRAVVNPFTVSDVPHETLHEINLLIGYRFPRQRGDLAFGVLNATGQDYHLNPVTPYAELPRKAVFYTRLRFRF